MELHRWGLWRIKYTQILSISHIDRETVCERLLSQNYQTPQTKDTKYERKKEPKIIENRWKKTIVGNQNHPIEEQQNPNSVLFLTYLSRTNHISSQHSIPPLNNLLVLISLLINSVMKSAHKQNCTNYCPKKIKRIKIT